MRARTNLGRAAVVATVSVVAMLASALPASADEVELPVNELASEITAASDLAVVALDQFTSTDEVSDFLAYAEHRDATARFVARQLGYDEAAMVNAWMGAPVDHQRAVLSAMTQVGVPYRTNASAEGEGFDCSGLTTYAWQQAGVELNRSSGDQIRAAADEQRESAKPGDLVYYPGHVMMYLGVDDAIIHSITNGRTVEIDTISDKRTDSVQFGDPAE